MRAEDLFEAMGELDEELIARSDRRIKAHSGKRKRLKYADLYRFAAVAITTAAAVFMLLMVRDFIGVRGTQNTKGSQLLSKEQEAESDNVEEAVMAEEAMEADEAADAGEAPAADKAPNESEVPEAEEPPKAGDASAADRASETEETTRTGGIVKTEEVNKTDEPPKEGEAEQNDAESEGAQSGEAAEDAAGITPQEGAKAAVDLMGEHKGDYISLEYISAKDAENGGDTKVPEYTPEGEKILTRALSNGKAVPAMVANTGAPLYYVYLTTKSGKVDTITFYEEPYVSMTTFPGVVMKVSQADYEEVLTLFR